MTTGNDLPEIEGEGDVRSEKDTGGVPSRLRQDMRKGEGGFYMESAGNPIRSLSSNSSRKVRCAEGATWVEYQISQHLYLNQNIKYLRNY